MVGCALRPGPFDAQKGAGADPSQVLQGSREKSLDRSGLIVLDAAQGVKGFLYRIGQQADHGLISHNEVHRHALTSSNGEALAAFFEVLTFQHHLRWEAGFGVLLIGLE